MEDIFNEGMSCVTHFVDVHHIFKTLRMFVTFSRHQMMRDLSYVVPCANLHAKGTFSYSNQSKEQNQTLDLSSLLALF